MPTAFKVQFAPPRLQFLDENGVPAAGYKIFIYEGGTTTKAETWTTADGVTSNTNPIILDARGECDVFGVPPQPDPVEPNPPGPPGPIGPAGPPGPPGPTGNTAEFSATVDILSETIYTGFYGEYIELVANEDTTVILIPVMIAITYKYQVIPYVMNGANFVVSWGPPIIPVTIPNGTESAAQMDGTDNKSLLLPVLDGMNGASILSLDAAGKPLTLTLDAAPDGAPVITALVVDGGADYAVGDAGTIDVGDGNATYEILTETAGVAETVSVTLGGTGYENDAAAATTATSGIGTGMTLNIVSALTIGGNLRIRTWYRKIDLQ